MMRYLLRDSQFPEVLLDQLVEASFRVIEGAVPEGQAEDVRVGLYVALHQVLSLALVKSPDCGSLPVCTDLREESPFSSLAWHRGARAR
jgi:hypothetical protein